MSEVSGRVSTGLQQSYKSGDVSATSPKVTQVTTPQLEGTTPSGEAYYASDALAKANIPQGRISDFVNDDNEFNKAKAAGDQAGMRHANEDQLRIFGQYLDYDQQHGTNTAQETLNTAAHISEKLHLTTPETSAPSDTPIGNIHDLDSRTQRVGSDYNLQFPADDNAGSTGVRSSP